MNLRKFNRGHFMQRPRLVSLFIAGFASLMLMAGCGSAGPDQHAVSGKVTLDGSPVENGTISFMSSGDGPPESAHANIVNGSYTIPADRGPQSGSFQVMIYCPKPTGKTTIDTDTGAAVPVMQETIPKKYNEESTLTIEIAGSESHDFELTTDN